MLSVDPENLLQQLIAELRSAIPEALCIYVFGSYAQGLHTPSSDIDLAVLPSAPLASMHVWNTAQKLAVVAHRDVDLVDLLRASTVFRAQVIAHGRRLFCADTFLCEEFATRTFSQYARLNEERREILGDIRRRGSVYGG